MREKIVVAVDWGTTQIEFAVVDKSTDRPVILKNAQGQIMTYNAIWFKNGDIVLGDKARRAAPVYPESVVLRFKPDLDNPDFKVEVNGRGIRGEELVEISARDIKREIERHFQSDVECAVVTVPAYGGELLRERIMTGFERAGFKVEKLLSEPVAASLAYDLESEMSPERIILVYDLGGGTFDVALVDFQEEKVLRNAGDLNLGGNDFDFRILERWREEFEDQHGFDPLQNPQVKAEWLDKAEQAKKDLSTDDETIQYLSADGRSITAQLKRSEFEALIDTDLQRTLGILQELLDKENLSAKEIGQIILVGGSTRIPRVKEILSEFWGSPVKHEIDPDLAVVVGAVVVAADIEGRPIRKKHGQRYLRGVLKDVTTHGLGVEVIDPETNKVFNHVMIKSGSELPASHIDHFIPQKDDVSFVEVTIIEGDDPDLAKCKVLQRGYKLPIKTPRKKELVRIEVKFTIDENGLVYIDATEDSGGELHEQFKHPAILGSPTGTGASR